jgi:hypothetical protein
VQQQQEGGEGALGVLAAEAQDCAPCASRVVVNIPDALALPFPEFDRLANVLSFWNPATVFDEPYCPRRPPIRWLIYWSSQGMTFAALAPALAAPVVWYLD